MSQDTVAVARALRLPPAQSKLGEISSAQTYDVIRRIVNDPDDASNVPLDVAAFNSSI